VRLAVPFFCLLIASSQAQDNTIQGFKMEKPPTIDGAIDPTEWQDVPSGSGQFDEHTGQKAADGLQFWLAYDAEFIYFAAKAHDSDPGSIRATEYQTNVSLEGDDSVTLLLDETGTLGEFSEFGMNPRGATSVSLAGGRAAKREWCGEFVAKGRVTAEGWEIEARIPWRLVRIPAAGARNLRFQVGRVIQRLRRSFVWRYTNDGHPENAGVWKGVTLPEPYLDRSIKLLPYVYAGADENGHIADAGLDFKTNLTNQITGVGSINPDFRNIENALLSLDFSRFERLADETRPFFQEGADYTQTILFASQRIRGFDVGINTYGRLSDKVRFGVLNTLDFGNQNSFASNFQYDITPNDGIGVAATSLSRPGFDNTAALVRFYKGIGPLEFFGRTAITEDTETGNGTGGDINVNYSKAGFNYFGSYQAFSPGFNPRLGFFPEVDYRGFQTGVEWNKPMSSGPLRQFDFALYRTDFQRFHGGHYRDTWEGAAHTRLANGIGLHYAAVRDNFLGSDDALDSASIVFPDGSPYRNFGFGYTWGHVEGSNYAGFSMASAYRPIPLLQLTASYEHVRHNGEEDQGILGLNYDFGGNRYLSGRAVKHNDKWNMYIALRKTGNRGAEYFLILGDPNSETFRTSLILKSTIPVEIH
jgi:hypothetical protein